MCHMQSSGDEVSSVGHLFWKKVEHREGGGRLVMVSRTESGYAVGLLKGVVPPLVIRVLVGMSRRSFVLDEKFLLKGQWSIIPTGRELLGSVVLVLVDNTAERG